MSTTIKAYMLISRSPKKNMNVLESFVIHICSEECMKT